MLSILLKDLWAQFQPQCMRNFLCITRQLSNTSWGSYSSTQFKHCILEIASDSTRMPHFRCQSQVQVITYTSDQPAVKQRFPTTPSLGLINLLKWLTELRKPIYSFDHQFIIKDLEEYDQIERYIW